MPGSFSRVMLRWTLLFLLLSMLAPFSLTVSSLPLGAASAQPMVTGSPIIDANFIYQQLSFMATHFLKREAGYDHSLPPEDNGHDEFADYWTREMLKLLGTYGAQARRDLFPIQGWQNRPPTVLAANVEITVPGLLHPEQSVIIGCHYDGMAFSTQSAKLASHGGRRGVYHSHRHSHLAPDLA